MKRMRIVRSAAPGDGDGRASPLAGEEGSNRAPSSPALWCPVLMPGSCALGRPQAASGPKMPVAGSGSPTLVAEVARRTNSLAGGQYATYWSPVGPS